MSTYADAFCKKVCCSLSVHPSVTHSCDVLLATSLTVKRKRLMESSCRLSHLLVGLSGKCTLAKRMIGSGCRLGLRAGRSRDGCIRWLVIVEGEGAILLNSGHHIVTNRDFATRLFPNYYGQDLLPMRRYASAILHDVSKETPTLISGQNFCEI